MEMEEASVDKGKLIIDELLKSFDFDAMKECGIARSISIHEQDQNEKWLKDRISEVEQEKVLESCKSSRIIDKYRKEIAECLSEVKSWKPVDISSIEIKFDIVDEVEKASDDGIEFKPKARSKKGERAAREARVKDLLGSVKDRCMRCGYSEFPVSLDLHHVNSLDKLYNPHVVCRLYINNECDYEVMKAEIDKCIPLCVNCHRAFHCGKWSPSDNKL